MDNNLQGGIWERQGDSLYRENLQVAPHPSTHCPLSQPQGTSVLLSPPVNNGVGCVLPERGVEGSHSTSPLLTSPPSGGTGTGNQTEQPGVTGMGLISVDRSTPSGLPPTQVPVGTPVAHHVNILPVGAVYRGRTTACHYSAWSCGGTSRDACCLLNSTHGSDTPDSSVHRRGTGTQSFWRPLETRGPLPVV